MEQRKSEQNGKNLKQSRVIIIVVLAIIVIFAVVVGLTLNIIGNHLMKQADSRYQIMTDNVAEEITTWFSTEAQIVLSHRAAIEIKGEYDPDYLTDYLTNIVQDYNDEGYIYDLYFVNTDNVMSSGYGYIPEPSMDFRVRAWYVNALKCDGLYYSAPYKDSNLDRYVVTLSTKCFRKDGELAGVLALDIFVDTLFSIANDKVIDGDSYVFLIDSNLGLATHPNPEYKYVDDEPILATAVPGGKYDYIVDYIYGNLSESALQSHYNIKDYDGVNRSVYVSAIDCCGWWVVAAVESSVFYAPQLKTLAVVVMALIICVVAGIISTRVFTGRIIRQLNEANEAAQIANEAKSSFLASMSHEIRTPINAIIGMNEMVIRENTDPNINDYALDIASASKSLVTIVNDILDFSKIESGKMELVEVEFNIASMINDIVNMSESRLGSKGLGLFFRVDPKIPVGLVGDENRIKQVILNMMTNAIKYTDSGYVTMRVEFTKQEYGINLSVFVKDTGIGIAEENIEQLYQSFSRFDAKKNRSIEGTGLGLAISKRMVQNMGGFINVESTLGVGSVFSICIPLKVTDEKPFISVENTEKIKLLALFRKKSMREDMQREKEQIFQEIRKGLDLQMKKMDSFEALQEALEKEPGVSHVLVDKHIYFEHEAFFENLSRQITVIVLQKRGNAVNLPDTVTTLFAPFYSIGFAALLNNKRHIDGSVPDKLLTFEAPDAKILIVDDNAMNLKVAAGLLKPYKMHVTTVDSGVKAIEVLKEDPTYDIVFMDHMMPIMDGIEATGRIRLLGDGYYKNLVIVALTANTINNAKSMFLNSGFDDFLAKPINTSFLDKMLRMYLPKEKLVASANRKHENSDNSQRISPDIIDEQKTSIPVEGTEKPAKLLDDAEGIKYTGGSRDLYLEIMKEYAKESSSMQSLIAEYFQKEDWANYVIKVHALKSTSLTIGAVKLSELAKELELSGKAQKYDIILQKNEGMLAMYAEVIGEVKNYLADAGCVVEEEKADAAKEMPVSLEDIDKEKVEKFVTEFKEALAEFDADRAEAIYENAKSVDPMFEKLFADVIDNIRNFEYDAAQQALESMYKSTDDF